VSHPVVIACIEQRDPGVECGPDRRDALRLVGRTVEVGLPLRVPAERGASDEQARVGLAERARVAAWPSLADEHLEREPAAKFALESECEPELCQRVDEAERLDAS
jgi:hypothetical protein